MLPYGEWIRLFRANGFEIEDLIEVQPPEGAESTFPRRREPTWAAGGHDFPWRDASMRRLS